jgi:CheY-like chemotaxis protein
LKLLLVEDEDPKRRNILTELAKILPSATIVEARSVNAALYRLRNDTYDLALLDISLPSFDVGPGEPGGRPQGFGGIEVLRSMDRYTLDVPVIVITAYEAFPSAGKQINLDTLNAELLKAHPRIFRGLVFYNSVFSTWSDNLRKLILGELQKK